VETPTTKQIDFAAYEHGFVGSHVLPPIPPPVELDPNALLNAEDEVNRTNYEAYFRYHLKAEFLEQEQENKSYSLYGHPVAAISHNLGLTTCSFEVPGLRENSPHVEEDDVVQLRLLHYDHMGKPLGMEEWLAPSSRLGGRSIGFHALGGRSRGEPAPGWTGIIYNGRVSAVQRKQEQLMVNICSLPKHYTVLSPMHNLKFNIQFPVPRKRYIAAQQALSIVQGCFRHSIRMQTKFEDRDEISGTVQSDFTARSSGPSRIESNTATWLQSMLFPTKADCDVQTNLNPGFFKRPFFDGQLNWEQKKATESICSQNYGTLPFLISGPPGTGKTKTLVEIALQLVKSVDKVSHILICAPSDPAADIILHRLSTYLEATELLRLNRPARTFAEVPGAVLPFCYVSQDKFDLPPFRQLMSYKVVVTTCRDASLLLYARLTNCDLYTAEYSLRTVIHPCDPQPSEVALHWTALLMDESAQAIEPDALIPLTIVAPPLGSVKLAFTPLVVMAGDEHQLGPRTSLRSTPLRTSLFARLFARPVYADHPLARGKSGKAPPTLKSDMLPIARPAFSNLIRNYRSHSAILAIPSALFYADTLEPEASDTDRLVDWPEWQRKGWPVLFRNNTSEDDIEKDGGGWYNAGEAKIACQYAALLVESGLVQQKEICIMSPFKAQVQCLRKTIREKRYGSLWDVDIGPTEAFQGLERGVVILCTTRSKERYVASDKEVDWGIIGLPNKMNVALTRAKFGLIVIGKKELLVQDSNWKTFLEFCIRNNLFANGDAGEEHVQDENRGQVTRLEKVLLAKEQETKDSRALKVYSQEDEMWTYGMQAALDAEDLDMSEYGSDDMDGAEDEEEIDSEEAEERT